MPTFIFDYPYSILLLYKFSHIFDSKNLLMHIMDNGNDSPAHIPFLEISNEKHDFINNGFKSIDT